MPEKKYIVRLEPEERKELESITTKGKAPAYRINHARILLKADINQEKGGVKKATGGALKFLSPLQATGHYGIFPTDRTTALQFCRPKGRGIQPSRD